MQVAGPNGMGKSSLIRMLAGLLRPFAGTVDRHGGSAWSMSARRWTNTSRWARRSPSGGGSTPLSAPLDRLGLADLLDVPVRYLSTGQRKRAALARLIGQGAPVWLLDEPLNGLDTEASR
jgi:heme exporter protein A